MLNVGYNPLDTTKLLYSIPKNGKMTVKVLVNSSGIISGEICTYGEYIWAYTGEDDPIHDVGGSPRWMAIVPVIAKIGKESKQRLNLRLPRSAVNSLVSLEGEAGLKGRIFEIIRSDGDGKSFVRYTVTDTGKHSSVTESEGEIMQPILDSIIQKPASEIRKIVKLKSKKDEEEL